ncbi:50S ribosomal protein L29 [Flammeovirga yaeyamensis]|uniref:Large ribosomal subunit protein uL29 n=1 Tax=Flammeovirga yaeyamensis TaxID=367791 RepID=A0AAX1N2R5_9BACT|nr:MULTISPECIES: 50S ribosomal protein L29 [Flammeovirga]ANQ50994.1 50S ribosomal protein L29 [Flammeovirga sp. MY04]MBB3701128.1 ribosomal protein L29 [Flammeovirga yaeyamensis]NMF38404.1 50S ribosomal protein L29 [Flammeovirga yaeyamensis]QWG01596.1 50S ribosomal protein L29 [Flammeovirga yaeyamensis]
MKTKELKDQVKGLSSEELAENIKTSQKQLEDLAYAHAVSPLENPMQLKTLKKQVARLKTELHARVTVELEEKVKADNVTRESISEFLQKSTFLAPVNKKMVLRAIEKVNN